MQYMGSKRRLAKDILPLILNGIESEDYYEPFAGGMNSIDKVLISGTRFANDINPFLIDLFVALQNGWVPKDAYTREEWERAKGLEGEPHEIGYMGFCCSFGAMWFSGYVKSGETYINRKDPTKSGWANRQKSTKNSIIKQSKKLEGVIFSKGSYREMSIKTGSTVYCDPPYKGTAEYKNSDFDHYDFWSWVREISSRCNVFVSEYSAPSDMTEIWSKPLKVQLSSRDNTSEKTEKLFVFEGA